MKKAMLLIISAICMVIISNLSLAEESQASKNFVSKFELGADLKDLLKNDFVNSDSFQKGVETYGTEELNNRLNIYLPKMVLIYQEEWNSTIEKEYRKSLNEKEILSLVAESEKSPSYPKFIKTKSEIEKKYRYITMTSPKYLKASTHLAMSVLLVSE